MYVYTTYTRPLPVQAQYSRSYPVISSFCYNSNLVTWTVICLTALTWRGSLNRTQSVESYSLGEDPQRTPLATPLLLLCGVTAYTLIQFHSSGCTRHISYRDNCSTVACGRYLATDVSVAPQLLLSANRVQYILSHFRYAPIRTFWNISGRLR
jgi:hypothetical protein